MWGVLSWREMEPSRWVRRVTVVLVLVFGDVCFAQDPTVSVVRADARAVTEKEIAIALLQARQTRPTGPQSTPEQDRISDLITSDYQFVQAHRARWRGTRYLAIFDQAVSADLRDPALRKENPFEVSAVAHEQRTGRARFNWFPWAVGVGLLSLFARKIFKSGSPPVFEAPFSAPTPATNWRPQPTDAPPPMPSQEWRICPACDRGKVRCNPCGGRGYTTLLPTTEHGASQVTPCTLCTNSGLLDCTTCSGTGRVWW